MATNTIKTRIQLKNDTEENWNKAINFVPLKGEVIIYSGDDAHPFCRLKVENGITTVSNLPFIYSNTLDKELIIDTTACVLSEDGQVLPWEQPDSTNAYMTGDKVWYNNEMYESLVDNNVWSPEAYPAGWRKAVG